MCTKSSRTRNGEAKGEDDAGSGKRRPEAEGRPEGVPGAVASDLSKIRSHSTAGLASHFKISSFQIQPIVGMNELEDNAPNERFRRVAEQASDRGRGGTAANENWESGPEHRNFWCCSLGVQTRLARRRGKSLSLGDEFGWFELALEHGEFLSQLSRHAFAGAFEILGVLLHVFPGLEKCRFPDASVAARSHPVQYLRTPSPIARNYGKSRPLQV